MAIPSFVTRRHTEFVITVRAAAEVGHASGGDSVPAPLLPEGSDKKDEPLLAGWQVCRRYSDFALLHDMLRKSYTQVWLQPPLYDMHAEITSSCVTAAICLLPHTHCHLGLVRDISFKGME